LWNAYLPSGALNPFPISGNGHQMLSRGSIQNIDAFSNTLESRSSVAILYFNLPSRYCGEADYPTNWIHPNIAPCDVRLYKERLYRLRCGGNISCQ
jgi:hypothetical protein